MIMFISSSVEHRRSLSPPSAHDAEASAAAAARSLSPPSVRATSPRNSRKRSLSPGASAKMCNHDGSSSLSTHTPSKRRPSSPDNVCCASCDVVQERRDARTPTSHEDTDMTDVEAKAAGAADADVEIEDDECTHAHQARRTTRASSPSSASRTRLRLEDEAEANSSPSSSKSNSDSPSTRTRSRRDTVTVTCIMTTSSNSQTPPCQRIILSRNGRHAVSCAAQSRAKDAHVRTVHFTSTLNSKARPFVPLQQHPDSASASSVEGSSSTDCPPASAPPPSATDSTTLNVNARPFVPRLSKSVSNGGSGSGGGAVGARGCRPNVRRHESALFSADNAATA